MAQNYFKALRPLLELIFELPKNYLLLSVNGKLSNLNNTRRLDMITKKIDILSVPLLVL